MSTVFAISSFLAEICGVGIGIIIPPMIILLTLKQIITNKFQKSNCKT